MREAIGKPDLKGVAPDVVCDRFSGEGWGRASVHVPSEMALSIYVNRQELVTILCTPTKLNCLVLGFLYAEGIISGTGDVTSMRVCEEESVADVMLNDLEFEPPTQRTLTSGCGGGTTFGSRRHPGGSAVTDEAASKPDRALPAVRRRARLGSVRYQEAANRG
jgi:FdhD protein